MNLATIQGCSQFRTPGRDFFLLYRGVESILHSKQEEEEIDADMCDNVPMEVGPRELPVEEGEKENVNYLVHHSLMLLEYLKKLHCRVG